MRLQVNEKSEIIGYAKKGDLSDSIEFTGAIPDNFEEEFKPYFFIIKNSTIIENPNYIDNSNPSPDDSPTSIQVILKATTGQLADHCAGLSEHSDEIAELKDVVKQIQDKLGLESIDN